MKKVTDLGANEVIHCPTQREAIEINRVLNPEWQTHKIKKAHDILGDKLCFRSVFNQMKHDTIDYYKTLGYTIHPASDFLPADFYKVDEAHSSVVVDPARHDEQPEQMSERKRKSFEFYDQLPEPLRTQAKENFDEVFSKNVPNDLSQAIIDGWLWKDPVNENDIEWYDITLNARDGIYNQPAQVMMVTDPTQPSPELLDAYNLLSSEGKKEMRKKHPAIKWPEEKRYVRPYEWMNNTYCTIKVGERSEAVLSFKNCRPEIDEEKGEIRFVKIG